MISEFVVVWDHRDLLFEGLVNTVWIAAVGSAGALVLGALLSTGLMSRRAPIAWIATALVDAMRCVPFLLFAYLIYYGLPSLGLSLSNWSSGLTALVIYHMSYVAELLRGSWRSLPAETIEAGRAFGFHGFGLFRRVILPPVVFATLPTLGTQVIAVIKDSAFLTIIAVRELTHVATAIQAQYYVPFASFIAAVGLYWVLCLAVEGVVAIVMVRAEARR
jgi:polar amino acid transport system permease protein